MPKDNTNLEDFFEIKSSGSAKSTASDRSPKQQTPMEKVARQAGQRVAQIAPSLSVTTASTTEITYSPSRTNNYSAARFLSALFKLLAWLFFVLTILSIGGAIYIYGESYTSYNNYTLGIDFYLSVFGVLFTLPMAPIFALLSESISVILDTEANTRQTTKTLERILRSQS